MISPALAGRESTRWPRAGSLLEGYAYNPTGDRLGKTAGGTTQNYVYDAGTHHLAKVGLELRDHDANGNLIHGSADGRSYTFDNRNRLTQFAVAGTTLSFDYNARGERVVKDDLGSPDTSAHFMYDEAGHLLSDAGNGNTNPTDYVWGDDRPVALVRNGTLYYVHSDQLGTPRAVTAAGSATPVWSWSFQGNPFGEAAPTGSLTVNLRFPGQYFDAKQNLAYNYYRDYEPATGRYIESDPVGLKGGMATYDYTDNSPLMAGDAFGLSYLFPGPRPDFTPCGYYDGMYAKTHCCYYHLAARTCRGDNPWVNAWLGILRVGAGQSNCIRPCLVDSDKLASSDCNCRFGSSGVCNKPSCVDSYHNKCYAKCGAPRIAYGGNIIPLVWVVQIENCN